MSLSLSLYFALCTVTIGDRISFQEIDDEWCRDGWSFIAALNARKDQRIFHVTSLSIAGKLQPGKNYVYVYPLCEKEYPFRITAIVVCEACVSFGLEIPIRYIDT